MFNNMNITRKTKSVLLPKQGKILKTVGENIKLARLRRHLSALLAAERAGISRTTLYKIENGDGSVAISAWVKALFVLGLEKDLLKIAETDSLGRDLQDAKLLAGGKK
jgi:transcriptional regulator with XRE-family HTH domain